MKATNKKKISSHPVPALRNTERRQTKSDLKISKLFAEHLSKVFQPYLNTPDNYVDEYLKAPLQMSVLIKTTTSNEINEIIKTLQMKKAPGYDVITVKLLRMLPKKDLVFLTQFYFRTGYYPNVQKVSQDVMILKQDKESNLVNSYLCSSIWI